METFQDLIQLWVYFILINAVLSGLLWLGTRHLFFAILTLHWVCEAFAFSLTGFVAAEEPIVRLLVPQFPAFFGTFTLAFPLAKMLKIRMPLKKFVWIPICALLSTITLYYFDVPPEILAIPMSIQSSSNFLYVAFVALKKHRSKLTFNQWALVSLFLLYGLHFYDFPYFYVRFELLIIGFQVALFFHMCASVLLPAIIIEDLTKAKVRLKSQLYYRSKLVQTARMAALGKMAGGVAHEINTPLAVASLSIEHLSFLAKEHQFDDVVSIPLKRSQTALDKISKIVKGLLNFAKEEPVPDQIFSMSEIIENVLLLCTERTKKKTIVLKVNFGPDFMESKSTGQPTQITQALLNLIDNSIESVEGLDQKEIELSGKVSNDHVEINIIDNGVGIPEEDREFIFDPFFTTKDIGKGTGLGLSTSKGIIEAHSGKIELVTTNSRTDFKITLPRS